MKKILLLAALFVLVLTVGAWGMTNLGNGITYTDEPVITSAEPSAGLDKSVEGMSAGGIRPEEKPLWNGVTYFEKAQPVTHEAAPEREVYNGITVF